MLWPLRSFAVPVPGSMGQRPQLASAEAVFETTDNDKDHDSIATIAVKHRNTVIASSSNTGGRWNDHTDHTVGLDTAPGWVRSALSGRTKSELSFSTNGNDKWEFNYVLRLVWDDGTTTENRYNDQFLDAGRSLSQLCVFALTVCGE